MTVTVDHLGRMEYMRALDVIDDVEGIGRNRPRAVASDGEAIRRLPDPPGGKGDASIRSSLSVPNDTDGV
jgi:hypothetical protein